jgi:hypothetical protein
MDIGAQAHDLGCFSTLATAMGQLRLVLIAGSTTTLRHFRNAPLIDAKEALKHQLATLIGTHCQ